MNAKLTKTTDTNWKGGSVTCACGWGKELGDGFNQYEIDRCPACDKDVTTRHQSKVTVGRPGNYQIKHGDFVYFAIDGCIQVQFSGVTVHTEHRSRLPR